MSLFRGPLLALAVGCTAVLVAGCAQGPAKTAAPAGRPSPPAACPSRADIAAAISKHDESQGVVVPDQVVCEGDWVTAPMSYPDLDPARAVLRRQGGRLSVVATGTDRLCDLPEMRQAPQKIRTALGELC